MATETVTTVTVYDDVDMHATPPVKTVATDKIYFSYRDSGTLVLDLTAEHAKELDDLMATWVGIASPAVTARKPRAAKGEGSDIPGRDRTPAELKQFRTWAADNDQPVHRYDGGGYKYDAAQLAAWDAARDAAESDKSKADDK